MSEFHGSLSYVGSTCAQCLIIGLVLSRGFSFPLVSLLGSCSSSSKSFIAEPAEEGAVAWFWMANEFDRLGVGTSVAWKNTNTIRIKLKKGLKYNKIVLLFAFNCTFRILWAENCKAFKLFHIMSETSTENSSSHSGLINYLISQSNFVVTWRVWIFPRLSPAALTLAFDTICKIYSRSFKTFFFVFWYILSKLSFILIRGLNQGLSGFKNYKLSIDNWIWQSLVNRKIYTAYHCSRPGQRQENW